MLNEIMEMSKYLTLIIIDKNKDTLKNYEEKGNQIKYFTKSKNQNSDDYDENDIKIDFNSDDDLPLGKH